MIDTDSRDPEQGTPLTAENILSLYIHIRDLAEQSLAVERDIVLKNYIAFGAILTIPSAGLIISDTADKRLALFSCGVIVTVISVACRIMSIYYSNYTHLLGFYANLYLKTIVLNKNWLFILRKREEKKDERAALLKNATIISPIEFITNGGILSLLNIFPAFGGIAIVIYCILKS